MLHLLVINDFVMLDKAYHILNYIIFFGLLLLFHTEAQKVEGPTMFFYLIIIDYHKSLL